MSDSFDFRSRSGGRIEERREGEMEEVSDEEEGKSVRLKRVVDQKKEGIKWEDDWN